jgi:hypothetical protein
VLDMTASPSTTSSAAPISHWQVPSSDPTPDVLMPWLRTRLVALVAALVIQAAIAAIQILPDLPGRQAAGFWAKFGVLDFLAAAIVSAAFGPRVRLRDVPTIGRIVLAFGFIVLPAVALALGGIEAARSAHIDGTSATISSWLGTALFGTFFFGLPILALVAPTGRAQDVTPS